MPELGSAAVVSLEHPSCTNEPSCRLHSAKNTMGSFRLLSIGIKGEMVMVICGLTADYCC